MSLSLYKTIARPALFSLDPELSHDLVHKLACLATPAWPLLKPCFAYKGDDLASRIGQSPIANPVGLAAGFDKNGKLVHMLGCLGFGFAEIGSVCARPFAGNAKPRLFRLPSDLALINRMGLNGLGAQAVFEHLIKTNFSLPVGINIAKTNDPAICGEGAIADMLYTFNKIKDLPITHVTVNASCPNTKEEKLAEQGLLLQLLDRLAAENSKDIPIFVKLSPDSDDELLSGLFASPGFAKLAGFVCGNTSSKRLGLKSPAKAVSDIGAGGLSGAPLKEAALKLCRKVWTLKKENQQIIGSGGIFSGKDAYDFIGAGASLVQIYTGLIYQGPQIVRQINCELSSLLARDGLTLEAAVGKDVRLPLIG